MRERLIGAVVLVIVAVILVPWLVSRAHHPEDIVTHSGWPEGAATASRPYVLPLHASRAVAASAPGTVAGQGAMPRQAATHVSGAAAPGAAPQSAPHPAAGGEAAPPPLAKGWSIQAASFSDAASARALAAKLRQAGFHVGLSSHDVQGTTWYQVRVGPYDSERRARDAAPGVARISNTKVLVRAPADGTG